jgi:Ca2+/H+ antiporter
MIITSVMLTGDENPTLARDTMFAVIMIILNGMVGLTLLVGGWRYREQQLNLQGSKSFLSVILLISILGLVLPDYTNSTQGPTLSPFLSIFLVLISLAIYGIFLTIQVVRHRKYFMEVGDPKVKLRHRGHADVKYSILVHFILLIFYLLPIVFLIKVMAIPIDFAFTKMHLPNEFGGLLVASLVLAPEAVVAVRAALVNEIQRSTNILLGSALATIGLTIPAVIIVGILTGKQLF